MELEQYLAIRGKIATKTILAEGEVVGKWRIATLLGKGGNGEVYRAINTDSGGEAAIKLCTGNPERLKREIEFLETHHYPFFPELLDMGERKGMLFAVLELLEPVELPEKDGEAAKFLLEVCRAVRTLHLNRLVHRDLKPQNLMRRKSGELVLIDFGLVKRFSASGLALSDSITMEGGKPVGAGTPGYAAPEQFAGGEVSPAIDIHALGVLANACFKGRPSKEWTEIIGRATSSLPERRYLTVDEFVRAIERRNRGKKAKIAAGLLLTAGMVAWWLLANGGMEKLVWHWMARGGVQLEGRTLTFKYPIMLESGREYRITGPGTLDAAFECGKGEEPARLVIENCHIVNHTSTAWKDGNIRYELVSGVNMEFPMLDYDDFILERNFNDFRVPANHIRWRNTDTTEVAAQRIQERNSERISQMLKRKEAEEIEAMIERVRRKNYGDDY